MVNMLAVALRFATILCLLPGSVIMTQGEIAKGSVLLEAEQESVVHQEDAVEEDDDDEDEDDAVEEDDEDEEDAVEEDAVEEDDDDEDEEDEDEEEDEVEEDVADEDEFDEQDDAADQDDKGESSSHDQDEHSMLQTRSGTSQLDDLAVEATDKRCTGVVNKPKTPWSGKYCCPSSCGNKCGGRGCSKAPGGAKQCCGSRIARLRKTCIKGSAGPCTLRPGGRFCADGVSNGKYCCAKSCGKCAGKGCGQRKGGPNKCCGKKIVKSKRQCGKMKGKNMIGTPCFK